VASFWCGRGTGHGGVGTRECWHVATERQASPPHNWRHATAENSPQRWL
jgi:hypothetical protein